MERATGTEVYDGCGSPQSTDITLNIQTTTGGNFSISLNGKNTIEHLKKAVSKKLRVAKDRICLLHRERQLRDGTLDDNGLLDGSRVILLPSVETGLLSQRPENSVMQALESLNDTQVNDFLSGKSPLNLTMRLGDHMMLIQLQLSTLSSSNRSLRTSTASRVAAAAAAVARARSEARERAANQNSTQNTSKTDNTCTDSDKTKPQTKLQKKDLELLQNAFNIYRSMTAKAAQKMEKAENNQEKNESMDTSSSLSDTSSTSTENDQSPIKSLSNLVSSPIDMSASEKKEPATPPTTPKSNLVEMLNNKVSSDAIPSTSAMSDKTSPPSSSVTPDSSLSDDSENFTDQSSFLAESTIDEYPMENLFNSAVDKGLFENQDESMMDREISNLATTSHGQESTSASPPSFQSLSEPLKNKRFQYLLHKTSKFKHPIGQSKQKAFMQSVVNKHKKRMQIRQESNLAQPSTSKAEPTYITNTRKLILQPSPTPSTSSDINTNSNTNITNSNTNISNTNINISNTNINISNTNINISNTNINNSNTIINNSNTNINNSNINIKNLNTNVNNSNTNVQNSNININNSNTNINTNANTDNLATPSTSKHVFKVPEPPRKPLRVAPPVNPAVDTKALIEASKNLTQKLKKLSKEVLTNKIDLRNAEESVRSKIGPGAVIESMKHHGKGIYSGTFSGTLNPALQDRYGRPKRDISTIIHILNDLLCAAPSTNNQKDGKHSCGTSTIEEPPKCPMCGVSASTSTSGASTSGASTSGASTSGASTSGASTSGASTSGANASKTITCTCAATAAKPATCAACKDADNPCSSCDNARALARDNDKTKCKLEQLRLVMQQKKQRREARKMKTLPYNSPPKAMASPEPAAPCQEEIETLA